MRLNKKVESKFKDRYDWVMEDLRVGLCIIAAFSVALNTMSSPILGIKALIIFIVSWYAAKFTETLYLMFSKEMEYSRAIEKVNESYPEVIGLTFALLIPIGTPIYAIIVSLGLAIIIAQVAFGGFSYNIFNVSAVAAAICYVSWPDSATPLLSDNYWLDSILLYFAQFLETPLAGIMAMPQIVTLDTVANATAIYPTWSIFTNNPQVALGLIPAVIIIPIGIRLMYNQVIDYKVPLMISSLTVVGGFLIAFLMHDAGFFNALGYGFDGLFGTIMVFVAIFVANDVVTTPNSTNTQFIYSLIIVIVSLYVREVSTNIEGVVYAILFANMFVPLLNAKSGTFSVKGIRTALSTSLVLFVCSMVFIGYNSNLEPLEYEQYDHYSIDRDKLICKPTDAEASASIADQVEANAQTNCTLPNTEESVVDAEASATME